MVAIMTDSTSDLGNTLLERHTIQVAPLYVFAGGKTYRDGIDITLEELYQSVKKNGELPKTSAVSVMDFQKVFDTSEEVVYIGISSQLSATFQHAIQAREMLPSRSIYLIDSLNLSGGIGLLVLKAADLRDQGLTGQQIAEQISELVPKVRTSFVVETLDYLYKGGRCSALQNIMGSLLSIRPIIAVRSDGTLGVKAKTRGTRIKALNTLISDFCENLDQIDPQRVFITHSGCPEDAEYLKTELTRAANIGEIHVTLAGSVIASHCGPDTIGILYLLK